MAKKTSIPQKQKVTAAEFLRTNTFPTEQSLNAYLLKFECQDKKKPYPLAGGRTRLTRFLEYQNWTVEEAASLAVGIEPDTIMINPQPDSLKLLSATSLSGLFLDGLDAYVPGMDKYAAVIDACVSANAVRHYQAAATAFTKRAEILRKWEHSDNPTNTVKPQKFVEWCKSNGIDTTWLAEIEGNQITGADVVESAMNYCYWNEAALALAERQTKDMSEELAAQILHREGSYHNGNGGKYPFPAPAPSKELLEKYPHMADSPRDSNAKSKLLMHREVEYQKILGKLHDVGKIEFYSPATHLRICDASQVSNPVVYMDKIAAQIIEYSEQTTTPGAKVEAAQIATANTSNKNVSVQPPHLSR